MSLQFAAGISPLVVCVETGGAINLELTGSQCWQVAMDTCDSGKPHEADCEAGPKSCTDYSVSMLTTATAGGERKPLANWDAPDLIVLRRPGAFAPRSVCWIDSQRGSRSGAAHEKVRAVVLLI